MGLAAQAAAEGATLIGTGEMSIANTTPSTALFAALVAWKLCPLVQDYLFFGHVSAETGHRAFFQRMKVRPLLDLEMCLGEGTGAALGMSLIEAAVEVYREMATFDSAGVAREDSNDPRIHNRRAAPDDDPIPGKEAERLAALSIGFRWSAWYWVRSGLLRSDR